MFDFIKELVKIEILYNDNDLDANDIVFKSYIKSVERDYILVDFLFYEKSEYEIPEGALIKVNFKDKLGFYLGNCYVLGVDNSRLPGIKISYPDNVEFVQQRDYARIPLKLKVELVIFPETEEQDIKLCEITTLDISGSGFCFLSNKPIKKHSRMVGIINLPSEPDEPIETDLKHVYSEFFITKGKEMYKNAFSFVDIKEELQEKILKEIFLYELEMRRKGI